MGPDRLVNQKRGLFPAPGPAPPAAPYELVAHTRALQREYAMDDGQIVELVATIAHVNSINTFEKAIAAFNDTPPMRAQDPSTPVLIAVRQKLGSLPRYFVYIAADPTYAKIMLDREVATVLEGEVSRLNRSEERRVGKECRSRWSPYQ